MKKLFWLLAMGLATVLVAQLFFNSPKVSFVLLSREIPPKNLREVIRKSQEVVLADVIRVSQGPDFVAPIDGHADEFHRVPSQRIIVQVIKSYNGNTKPGQTLTLYQDSTGITEARPGPNENPEKIFLQVEGNPLYKVGEQYLLALRLVSIPNEIKQYQPETWEENLMIPTFMEGRILVGKDRSVNVAGAPGENDVVRAINGKRLENLESQVAAALKGGK